MNSTHTETTQRRAIAALSRKATGGVLTVADAAAALGVDRRRAATWLARLAKRGWLSRGRRGVYLVSPMEASPDAPVAVEDSWALAARLYSPAYIGGWSAAEHWGLTEQIFRSTFVVTAAHVRTRLPRVAGASFRVVKVDRARLQNTTLVWRGRYRVAISDREKTIVDACANPDWVGGVRHLCEIFSSYLDGRERSAPKLLARANELGRGAAFKRLGFLAERLWPEAREIVRDSLANRSAGNIKLDPAVRTRGKLDKRWGLWINVSVASPSDHA